MQSRTKNMVRNIKYSFLIKGVSLPVSFLMIRVLIDKLTPDGYAVWIILSSTLGMLSFFNIGLGNGMRNMLFESFADGNNRKSKEIISTAYLSLAAITLTLSLIAAAIFPLFNWNQILNTPSYSQMELLILALMVFCGLMAQLELNLIVSIMQAKQLTAYGDMISVIGQILSLVGVMVLPLLMPEPGLIHYCAIIVLTPIAITLLFSLYLFLTKLKDIRPSLRFYNKEYLHSLLGVGAKFFVIQVAWLIMYQSNSIIIAHVIDTEQVTTFNVAYKYCSLLQMIFILLMDPTWSAAGDAYVKREFDWIRNTERRLNRVWQLFLGISICQCLVAPIVYKIWIGNAVSIHWTITLSGIIYFIVSMKAAIYCNIINGTGKIKLQHIMYVIQAVAYIPIAIVVGRYLGVAGIFAAMSFIQLTNIVWMSKQYNLLTTDTATGIWNK